MLALRCWTELEVLVFQSWMIERSLGRAFVGSVFAFSSVGVVLFFLTLTVVGWIFLGLVDLVLLTRPVLTFATDNNSKVSGGQQLTFDFVLHIKDPGRTLKTWFR